jgi:putative tryptophan/tyrosine transport system substrate-binding protein
MSQMRRRNFITLIGGAAAAWPLAARGQQGERMRRIGVLMATAENDAESQHRIAALRAGLQKLGWTEGRNLRSEYCWGTNDLDRMRTCAEELAALKPEVIFAAPTSALAAMHRATSTIPIVFAQVADPVANGFVASNSHPGGNVTGFATYEYAVGLKWVELLKQIAPQVTRIAVLYDPEQPAAAGYVAAIEAAARSFSVRVVPGAVRDAAAIERTIEAFAGEPNGGLILPPTAFTVAHRALIISLAVRYRLPNIFALRYNVVDGGLASYGVDNIDLYGRAAEYVDRILKGEKPGDLPIQFATKFELVINLKTARALGLEIPIPVLARTDEVIE